MDFVAKTRIANLLDNKPEGVHVDDLAKLAGVNADKLGRVLRMMATSHVFKEGRTLIFVDLCVDSYRLGLTLLGPVSPSIFANNRLSQELISEDEYPSMYAHQ